MATTKAVGGVVDPPSLAAAPFGLVNRLTLQSDDARWEAGVGFESLACAGKIELWGICDDTSTVVFDGAGNDRVVNAPAFGITVVDTCTSTFGSDFREKAEGRVRELLEASTQKAVEWELRRGAVAAAATPVGRWLASPESVVVDGSGVCPRAAVALLEDAYAGCGYGGGGVLHMTPGAATGLRGTIGEDDGVMFTETGTQVVIGSGYVPVAVDAAPWDENWMWVTGPTMVWLGEPNVYPESLDQAVTLATNDIKFKAERLAAVTFDGCCVFAVKVDLTKTC